MRHDGDLPSLQVPPHCLHTREVATITAPHDRHFLSATRGKENGRFNNMAAIATKLTATQISKYTLNFGSIVIMPSLFMKNIVEIMLWWMRLKRRGLVPVSRAIQLVGSISAKCYCLHSNCVLQLGHIRVPVWMTLPHAGQRGGGLCDRPERIASPIAPRINAAIAVQPSSSLLDMRRIQVNFLI